MGNCCQAEDKSNFDLNFDKDALFKDFDYISSTLNPFYSYNLKMIEDIERRFFLENIPLIDFIDIWLTGFLNAQVKKTYNFCKQDLDNLFTEEGVSDIVFLNLLLLVLSPSHNGYFKKEYICYLIIDNYIAKDSKNFTLLINSVVTLISICVKISVCFIYVFLIFDSDCIEDLKELFEYSTKHNSLTDENGVVDIQKKTTMNSISKTLNFDKNKPYFTIDNDIKHSFNNSTNKNLDTICKVIFHIIGSNYAVKTHSTYDKYIDYISGFCLQKLFFNKADFSNIQEHEIKNIIQDIVEIISAWKLFELIVK